MKLFKENTSNLFPKLEKESFNAKQEKIEKLKELFPNIVSDGKIDWKTLKLILGENVTEEDERYRFTWTGKTEAINEANIPTTKTLRPDKESSKNWETTENLYIEGDNLEALKILQNSYNGKIKMIYIDPPYNTGSEFIYKDDFTLSLEEVEKQEGLKDKNGIIKTVDRLTKNSKDSAKYHTNWLNMMYPRLSIARDLLTDEGAIFISISNEEFGNLKKICDEIFGESNYVETYLWEKTSTPPSLSSKSRKTVEYILCYEKNKNTNKYFGEILENGDVPLINTGNTIKELIFPQRTIQFKINDGIYLKGVYEKVELLNNIEVSEGTNKEEVKLKGPFKWTQEKLEEEISNGTYFLVKTDKFSIRFQREENGNFKTPNNFLGEIKLDKNNKIGTNETASKELEKLKMKSFFDYPKPQSLIKNIINFITYQDKEGIILDFFSGSATTANAVIGLNAEDGGNRKFIMIQIPEITYEGKKDKNGKYIIDKKTELPEIQKDSEARKAGFNLITEIGKERIHRAGEQLLEEKDNMISLDIGFKTFKIDSSNFNEWDTSYEAMEKATKDSSEGKFTTYKQDRTELDLVYEIILKEGLFLTENIEEIEMNAGTLYKIADGIMYIFLKKLDEEVIEKIINLKIEAQELFGLDNPTVILNETYLDTQLKSNAKKNFEVNGIINIKTL